MRYTLAMECQRADGAGMDLLSAALPSASRASLHAAICDSCDTYIVGTRYHCTNAACEDFDLCDRCTLFEGKSHLQAHSLLVLQRPLASHVIESMRQMIFVNAEAHISLASCALYAWSAFVIHAALFTTPRTP